MAKILDWDDHIGRRLRLRDLRVFFLVVQSGSFAQAAARLRVSQPAVSRVIADLERSIGAKLFDRGTRGVEPTLYGRALLLRGRAAFDELRQGIGDIELLADPGAGQIRVGAPDVLMGGFVGAVIDRLAKEFPRIEFHTMNGNRPALAVALRERIVDVIVSRRPRSIPEDDLSSEQLFEEELFVVAGVQNQWAHRRKFELSDLMGEHWVLPPPSSVTGALIAEGFHAAGFAPPKLSVATDSIVLRNLLLATGRYLSVLPGSILHFAGRELGVRILPVALPPRMFQPTEISVLKDRTLSPAVERFIQCARDTAKSIKKLATRRTGARPDVSDGS
jgi:DNA-binding transcriptional LysR family regulator